MKGRRAGGRRYAGGARRCRGDDQRHRDLSVRRARGDKVADVALAAGELLRGLARATGGGELAFGAGRPAAGADAREGVVDELDLHPRGRPAAGPAQPLADLEARTGGLERHAKVKLRLKAVRAYRRELRSLRGKTLTITVKAGGSTTRLKRKLR